MKKIIVFDFNRTLYDHPNQQLFAGVREMLAELCGHGFDLYLICQNRKPQRNALIEQQNILTFFKQVHIVPIKLFDHFQQIATDEIDRAYSYVVGDFIKQEITFGNRLGFQTIWIKDDSLPNNFPVLPLEQPTHTIKLISEILDIITVI